MVVWAQPYGADWQRLIAECPRADWLLGIGARMGIPAEALARAALACVRLAVGSRQLPEVARDALGAVHASAIHWEPFADCGRAADRCDAAADLSEDAAEAALLRASAAVARTLTEPACAAAAAALSIEVRLAYATDHELVQVMLESQQAAADAARVHLPFQFFDAARRT